MGLDQQADLGEDEEEEQEHVLEALKPIVREASIMKPDTHHQVADFHIFSTKQSISKNE